MFMRTQPCLYRVGTAIRFDYQVITYIINNGQHVYTNSLSQKLSGIDHTVTKLTAKCETSLESQPPRFLKAALDSLVTTLVTTLSTVLDLQYCREYIKCTTNFSE